MLNNILLNSGLNAVAFNTVAIFGIILAFAFVFSLVVDLIFLIFAPKRNGLFFKRAHQKDKDQEKAPQVIERIIYKDSEVASKQPTITPYQNAPTVIPYSELEKTEELFTYDFNNDRDDESKNVTGIDFQKAIEEQKLLEQRHAIPYEEDKNEEVNVYSIDEEEDNSFESMFRTIENEMLNKKEEDIDAIIADVQAQAMAEILDEGREKVRLIKRPEIEFEVKERTESQTEEVEKVEESVEEEVVEEEVLETPKRKVTPKIIFRVVQPEPEKEEIKEPEIAEQEQEIKQEKSQDDIDLNELRKIREDIFNTRVQAFNELRRESQHQKPEEVEEVVEVVEEEIVDEETQEKLEQLEIERQALIKTNLNVLEQKEGLEKKVESLVAKIENLESQPVVEVAGKPAQSKEYYENRLVEIEEELKDVQKDLRKNKREFNPLRKIKRTFDRDVVKLRRKEATVAKEKLRIYGVNKTENIDEERVKKLEEEVKILKKLKDSVHQCELVLEQNKDRYPVLENSIKILTRHVESLTKEKEAIEKEIEWFENN